MRWPSRAPAEPPVRKRMPSTACHAIRQAVACRASRRASSSAVNGRSSSTLQARELHPLLCALDDRGLGGGDLRDRLAQVALVVDEVVALHRRDPGRGARRDDALVLVERRVRRADHDGAELAVEEAQRAPGVHRVAVQARADRAALDGQVDHERAHGVRRGDPGVADLDAVRAAAAHAEHAVPVVEALELLGRDDEHQPWVQGVLGMQEGLAHEVRGVGIPEA